MQRIQVTDEELDNIVVGEAITIGTIMAILSVAITMVICYRIYKSKSGKTSLPGGFSFTWN